MTTFLLKSIATGYRTGRLVRWLAAYPFAKRVPARLEPDDLAAYISVKRLSRLEASAQAERPPLPLC